MQDSFKKLSIKYFQKLLRLTEDVKNNTSGGGGGGVDPVGLKNTSAVPVNPATDDTLNSVRTLLTPVIVSHNYVNTAASGTVPANTKRGSVSNIGNQDGTWAGSIIPAGTSIPWGDTANGDLYSSIAYDPTTPGTGTTFLIEYTK